MNEHNELEQLCEKARRLHEEAKGEVGYDKLCQLHKRALDIYMEASVEVSAKVYSETIAEFKATAKVRVKKMVAAGELENSEQMREDIQWYIQECLRANQEYIEGCVKAEMRKFERIILCKHNIPTGCTYVASFNPSNDWIHFRLDPNPAHIRDRANQEVTGWKCHISICPDDLGEAWPIISQRLFASKLGRFKLITKPSEFEVEQKGKQVVTYTGYDFGIEGVGWEDALVNIERELEAKRIKSDTNCPYADRQLGHYTSCRNDYMDQDLLKALIGLPGLGVNAADRMKAKVDEIIKKMGAVGAAYIEFEDIQAINEILEESELSPLKYCNPSDIPAGLGIDAEVASSKLRYTRKDCQHFNPFQDPFESFMAKLLAFRDRNASVGDKKLSRSKAQEKHSQLLYRSDRIGSREAQVAEPDVEPSAIELEVLGAGSGVVIHDEGPEVQVAEFGAEQHDEESEVPDAGPDIEISAVEQEDPGAESDAEPPKPPNKGGCCGFGCL